MRRFFLQHVFLIFSVCMIATSSYVLFDLLDIDGSQSRGLAQACGFEAVMPDASGEVKLPTAHAPAPPLGPLRDLLFTAIHYNSPTSCVTLPSPFSSRTVHTRNATQSDFASPAQGSEPAQRFV